MGGPSAGCGEPPPRGIGVVLWYEKGLAAGLWASPEAASAWLIPERACACGHTSVR